MEIWVSTEAIVYILNTYFLKFNNCWRIREPDMYFWYTGKLLYWYTAVTIKHFVRNKQSLFSPLQTHPLALQLTRPPLCHSPGQRLSQGRGSRFHGRCHYSWWWFVQRTRLPAPDSGNQSLQNSTIVRSSNHHILCSVLIIQQTLIKARPQKVISFHFVCNASFYHSLNFYIKVNKLTDKQLRRLYCKKKNM